MNALYCQGGHPAKDPGDKVPPCKKRPRVELSCDGDVCKKAWGKVGAAFFLSLSLISFSLSLSIYRHTCWI